MFRTDKRTTNMEMTDFKQGNKDSSLESLRVSSFYSSRSDVENISKPYVFVNRIKQIIRWRSENQTDLSEREHQTIPKEPFVTEQNNYLKKLKIGTTTGVVFLCICTAVITLSMPKNGFGNNENAINRLTTVKAIVSNCNEGGAFGRIGDLVCFSPNSSCSAALTNEILVKVTIKRLLSLYNNFATNDFVHVEITKENFNILYNGWIVVYNASEEELPLKVGKINMTCSDIGAYSITLHYHGVSKQTCKFDVDKTSPQLSISSNEKNDIVFVSCEMSNICSDAYLSLFIYDGNSTIPVRTGKQTGCDDDPMTIIKQVALNKSLISSNSSISCKPNTDEIELNDNSTITIPLCKNRYCSETCKEEEKGLYFEHPIFCNKFYQCEYPALHLRPCPDNEQWNFDACTCDLVGNVAVKCNNISKTYDPPIDSESLKSCGGPQQTR